MVKDRFLQNGGLHIQVHLISKHLKMCFDLIEGFYSN